MDVASATLGRATQDQIHESDNGRHLRVLRQLCRVDNLNFRVSKRFHFALDISSGKGALWGLSLFCIYLVY
jgi:hypothetical protein